MNIRVFDLTNPVRFDLFPIHIIISILIFGFARRFEYVFVSLCVCVVLFLFKSQFLYRNSIELIECVAVCHLLASFARSLVLTITPLKRSPLVVLHRMIHLIFATDFIGMSLYFDVAFIEIYNAF